MTSDSYFPGHIHAFYLEYVYYDRRNRDPLTRTAQRPAPGVYSTRIQNGGHHAHSATHAPADRGYGTM